ncbi:bacteriocin [Streptococcus thermophilus]|nr:bacteriocin [Streptococcus thermophilus]MDI3552235.1 bacteriocin [Streptococcus thermophilus]
MATQTIENLTPLTSKHLLVLKEVDVVGEAQVERLFKELSEEGAFGGNVVLPVVGSVPGYLAGGVLGGAGGTVAYGATCWWS